MPPTKKSADAPQAIEVGDIVLAKVKGFPFWPAKVIDPETAPLKVKKDRPRGVKTTFYLAKFFPAGDHAWVVGKDIQPLKPHDIDAFINEPSKKNGELRNAYIIAKDPSEWEANQLALAKAAAEAAKNAPVDELDDDGESGSKKKRKRESVAGEGESAKKAAAAKKTPSKKRGKKNGVLSAETIPESEDEGAAKKDGERPAKKAKGDEDEEDEESLSEEAKLVKGWRHELQRIFLSKNSPPKAEDMEKASNTLDTVEKFGPSMTIQLMSTSKIGKVVKKITSLAPDAIPEGDTFNIRARSHALLVQWSALATNGIPASTTANGADAPDAEAEADPEVPVPAINGDGKMDVDAVAEPAPEPVVDVVAAPADVEMKTDGAEAVAAV